ncbi:Uncharacterized protein MSYG_0762 [Malassezia sympodialis ATCC 42132]|uniref:Ubiquinone biosynthesis protein n=1 Tax=Malassezia sympodialis (strain ATCC 42132) TaxID=1230383 RepID=A0A1M8A2N3_MALS4|nr:Uncharacterized protein MSYG_0762 [Malassezia sympodialis ATCC 42132]
MSTRMAGRPAVESLLRAALAHVPSKGFTLVSIRSAIPTASQWKPSNVDRALSVMFPGPDSASTSAPRRLFQTWDNHVTEELNEKFRHVTGLSNDEQAVQWLCDRLMKSDAVKSHLLLPLSLISKESCFTPINTSVLLTVPISVPNPGPLMMRAVKIAEEACFATDMITEKGPLWYTTRMRLAFAYGAAELALATLPSVSAQEAVGLFQRISQTPGVYDISQHTLTSLKIWATWGGRGWLGILRSFGL